MKNNIFNRLKSKIKDRKAAIAVIGLGYVGLPLAIEFARKGYKVYGIETDRERLARLRRKEAYITDIDEKSLKSVINLKKLIPCGEFNVLKEVDAIIICVPTPLKKKLLPDISFIKKAVKDVSAYMKKGALVVLESTTYPGTTEEVILPLLETKGKNHGVDFFLCFSPERIDPGNKNYPVSKIPKVIGGISQEAGLLGSALYKNIVNKVVLVSSTRVAEITKLLENTFRIVNIGLIDELAMMACKMRIDIWEVINAASTKPFGFMPFYPGPGVGGHCIPKDPLYLYWKAKKFGFKSRFIKLASDIISYMPEYTVKRVEALLAGIGKRLRNSKILVLGATYKKDIKDLRQSPSLDIIRLLREKGSVVCYHDPIIPYLSIPEFNSKSLPLTKNNIARFDCIIVATDHTNVDYNFVYKNSRLIFDTRNVYKSLSGENKKVVRL